MRWILSCRVAGTVWWDKWKRRWRWEKKKRKETDQFITSDYCVPQHQHLRTGAGLEEIKAEARGQRAGHVSKETSCAEDKHFLMVTISIFRGVLLQQMSAQLFSHTEITITNTLTPQILERGVNTHVFALQLETLLWVMEYLSCTWRTA